MSAKTASVEAEATGTPTVIEHGGREYTIPAPKDVPLEVVWAQDDTDIVRLVLGEDQWSRYLATRPTLGDFQALAEKINTVGN
ncbi:MULTISPECIES: hypothetical protein [Streptomycetaceae]|uniref:Uncharacterized protein n=1 Tax=Streptantibioticus cattleyicolor (strain ATCC 35852 / DSM 46488 / JCM 4925 / NBRC 14057 / NRRL 8057) TaxID=1003195 RepID=F8JPY7_STREN|nr:MULTISPECIES: hypothetical protein [Streptomycetaceae]AEW94045.1 hypothetical protein SCATT_16740 [Streptantibioticus cattleyicolor NRRL 8057 = DSM 46488]MYS58718.1 hypothetical protein [Streptomyces sp. SID5468]CCB74397.1 protein of unknown function [Streptantibioticus cattleyicolor NRRL 8057 = DSM 46488]